jgi:nucleotide-binding universal stress UspA family protein
MAFVPDKESIVLPRLNSILVALDSHDWVEKSSRFSYSLAAELSVLHGAYTQIVCMAVNQDEFEKSENLVDEAVEFFKSRNIDCNGICIIGSPSSNILKLVDDESHDIVILPSPYAERIEKDNLDSLGTTVEIILNNSPVPVLLVPEPKIRTGKISDRILLYLAGKDDIAIVEWGLLFSDEDTSIQALNIIRKDLVDDVIEVSQDLLNQEIDENLVEFSLKKNRSAIISAFRDVAKEMKLDLSTSECVGDPIMCLEEKAANNDLSLIVLDYSTAIEDGASLVKYSKKEKTPIFIIK